MTLDQEIEVGQAIIEGVEFNYISEIHFSIAEHWKLITIQEFIDNAASDFFTDYGIYGELATNTLISDIQIHPHSAANYKYPSWCTHIFWYTVLEPDLLKDNNEKTYHIR